MLSSLHILAQQYTPGSLNEFNASLYNPAFSGVNGYTDVSVTHRQQWIGIKDAPVVQVFMMNSLLPASGHKRTNISRSPVKGRSKEGLGIIIINDGRGAVSRLNGQINYAHHIKLSSKPDRYKPKPNLSLSMALGIFQLTLDESDLEPLAGFDPIITYGIESIFIPYMNFGALLYSRNYHLGFAVNYLTSKKFTFDDITEPKDQVPPQMMCSASYTFKLNTDYSLRPSAFVQYNAVDGLLANIGTQLLYRNLMLGAAFRSSMEFTTQLGIELGRYKVAYAYDYATEGIAGFSGGSHEVFFRVHFGEM
jgi:type IX secretion system PorP/SprF family membrane protein